MLAPELFVHPGVLHPEEDKKLWAWIMYDQEEIEQFFQLVVFKNRMVFLYQVLWYGTLSLRKGPDTDKDGIKYFFHF